jgi:hypothetical protein
MTKVIPSVETLTGGTADRFLVSAGPGVPVQQLDGPAAKTALGVTDGADGADGSAGADGEDGLSAYQVAVANGFVGDETAWLASLVGAAGPAGADGEDGATGATGATGPQGEPGEGVAAGGTTGQVLAKASATDYDTEWVDQSGVAGGVIHQRPYSSDSGSYCGDDVMSAAGTLLMVANRKYLIPQRFSKACTISEVAVGVTGAVAGTNIRIGLRSLDQSTGIPGALVADFGTVSSAATGLKQITSLSQAVTAGIHCWEIVSDGGPTLRGAVNGASLPLLGFSVSVTTFNVIAFLYRAFTYGTLPSDESSETQTVQAGVARPSIMFKAS